MRELVLLASVLALGCRAPVPSSALGESPEPNPAAAVEPDPEPPPPAATPPPKTSPDASSVSRDVDDDVWGNRSGEPIPEWYGCGGFGVVPGTRIDANGLTLDEEAEWLRGRLTDADEELEALAGCVRMWAKRERKLRAREPVDEEALAELEEHRAMTEAAVARVEARKAGIIERLEQLDGLLRERSDERRKRREMIEAGICPQEPCPPGTKLPGAPAELRR